DHRAGTERSAGPGFRPASGRGRERRPGIRGRCERRRAGGAAAMPRSPVVRLCGRADRMRNRCASLDVPGRRHDSKPAIQFCIPHSALRIGGRGGEGMSGAPTVAIIGRPNVGKSTLFNRLIGGRDAIVDPRPGVTRDRHFGAAEWNGRRFWLVDTGGMVPGAEDQLNRAIRTQVEAAVAASDVVLFLVDVEAGVHPADLEIAQYLRKASRPVILVANKADQLPKDTRHLAFYELGLGDPFPVSAAIGKSSGDLLDRVVELLPAAPEASEEAEIHVAVVGRPNVGKSSLVNRLLGEERAPFLRFIPFLYLSAKTGQRVPKLLELILEVADERAKRVPTSEVNRVLEALVDRQQPPQPVGESVRLLYASQIGIAPPRF